MPTAWLGLGSNVNAEQHIQAAIDALHEQFTSVELSPASNNTKHIVHAAIQGLKEAYREGFKFKKAGVMLLDLIDADHAPQSLFDNHDPKDDKLIEAFDQINRRLGPGSINFGTAGQASKWHSASAYQSPRYTTEWDAIPVVKT